MKKKLGARMALYPMPVTLIGATVEGKPNFITIAHVGIMDLGTVSLGMSKVHYTNRGIKENAAFSVNIAPVHLVKETDYCGLVSGSKTDKAALFDIFYGELETAPMIEQCPLNLECRLVQTVDMPQHDIFVGEVLQVYCNEECLEGAMVDYQKVEPLLFAMGDPARFTQSSSYYALGARVAGAWDIGKELPQ